LTITGIDIRFAICQPLVAETRFRDIVQILVQSHNLSIHEGYRNCRYQPTQISAYLDDMTPLVAGLRVNWQRLFGSGYEEKALSVAEAWGYYLNRQRSDAERASN
jgi:hypothetical protein